MREGSTYLVGDALGVFSKYWQPGQVKTRLAIAVGNESAAALHREFLLTTLQRFVDQAENCCVVYTPSEHALDFQSLAGPRWHLDPQATGDLGQRMQHFFDSAFAAGAERVVIIGADTPTLPLEYVRRAFRQLREADVALGPTTDGGYYLIGAAAQTPPIFAGIAWSTSQVWRQTTEILESRNIRWAELPGWYDVDEQADLDRLDRELSNLTLTDESWRQLFTAVRTHAKL